jgi:hypothetical protein
LQGMILQCGDTCSVHIARDDLAMRQNQFCPYSFQSFLNVRHRQKKKYR